MGGAGGVEGGGSVPTLIAQKGEVRTTGLRAHESENNSSFRLGPLVRELPRAHAGQTSGNC
jgi:hypothetical protein